MKRFAVVTCIVTLSGCGGSSPSGTTSVTPAPNVAGSYSGSPQWTLQVLRKSDNFQKSFTCAGKITLSQGPGSSGVASLGGFLVVGSPCEPISFDLVGTVQAGGAIAFTSGGPRPTEGPCPGGTGVQYTGQITGRLLSARGVTTVQCPEFGEHTFTYLLGATKG